jgi:hypothetical protein
MAENSSKPDNLSRPVGAGGVIELNGEKLIIPAFTLRDLGTVENHLLQVRRRSIIKLAEDAYADSPPDVRKEMRQQAWQEANKLTAIGPDECLKWMDTLEGVAFTTGLLVQKGHPGKFTYEQVKSFVYGLAESGAEELADTLKQVAGVDPAGETISSPPSETGKIESR